MIQEKKMYKYSGKWIHFFLGTLMFGASTFLFYYKAINNNESLVVNNLIKLNINEAMILFWVLFSLSSLMILACFYGVYSKIKGNKFLIIDDHQVIIPAVGIQKKAIITFKNVSNVNETKVNGNFILTIYSKNKKRSIINSLFTKNEKYIEVKNFILKKINEHA